LKNKFESIFVKKGGDLLETVTKRSKFEEKEVVPMVYSLASALSYLHSLNIVHRDVKLENILVINNLTMLTLNLRFNYFNIIIIDSRISRWKKSVKTGRFRPCNFLYRSVNSKMRKHSVRKSIFK
jgi:serine/threonine protein kinase